MSEQLNALRKLVMSDSVCCARIVRASSGADWMIERLLNNASALAGVLKTGRRLTNEDIRRLVEAIPPATPTQATKADVEHVKFMATF